MLKSITSGIKAYIGAFSLLSKLKLWKFFVIPMFISVITASLISLTAYTLSDNLGEYIAKVWIWDWGKAAFTALGTILGLLIIIAIGLILFKHIIMALSAPFMSPVSEKIETHLTGNLNKDRLNSSFTELLWRGIRINIRNLIRELLFTIPILVLKFVPIVNIFSTIALFFLQSYYAGFGNMDYTLERHYNYKNSINFVRENRGLAIGNGIIFMLFLFIPIVGVLLVLPLSVTAATTETIKVLKKKN
ncbi:EI24 domain-containing protein [Tamlana sp. 2_MG-2023]|uniref:EI24 domain-containing protein n=1 Tax=unclassified Tamlana TaxID=2614803 RepID=UPI0026E2E867|nr:MULTISPECIES: EI24 domain-containing protein [unclassified Tamlana]MDO6759819.1 EI24 domain-containing protein [Tamlana sp. 2_MG-2023]MDO6791442.1 EI24 domain-containing protein [Tamlana sp. 1_MG-2023]